MNFMKCTLLTMGCLALLLLPGPAAANTVIFDDQYDSPDQDPIATATPGPGTYDASSSAASTSGYLQTFAGAGQVKAAGNASQTSGAGTILRFEWDWNLLSNDNPGTTYNPIAGLGFNADDRALGIRAIYAGVASPGSTSANVFFEQAGGGFADSGLDVPTDGTFRTWTIDYTVGAATATLNVDGVAALTNVNMPVAFPAQSVVGPWFLGSGATNSRFDNVKLTVIPEPTSLVLLGLGVCLGLASRRRD